MAGKPYRILRIPILNTSCYLIYNDHAAILVDTAYKGSTDKILESFDHLGLERDRLKMIVITHVHYDHAGSAREIKKITGAPVAVHKDDADRLRKGYSPLPDGTRWKAKLLVGLGRIFFRRLGRIPAMDPDILLEDKFDLEKLGIPGTIYHMPGHTPGSVIVLLKDGDALVGDTLFGLKRKEIFPPFADDKDLLLTSWGKLFGMQVKYLYPGHGSKIRMEEFRGEFESAMRKYAK
jgi:glyoxylase-like metal-dependent hydrolase (beta-lactamase superfamily II)